MTSLREAIRRLVSRTQKAEPPDPEYSYTIFWTKMARDWDSEKRTAALAAAEHLIGQVEFAPTTFERRFADPRIDDSKHSGESLLALRKVLKAFEEETAS